MPFVFEAKPEHIDPVARLMRKADIEEIRAASGKSPKEALEYSLDHSNEAKTIIFNGAPAAMFGVGWVNMLNGIAAPWLLGTDAIDANYRQFLRGSKWWVDQLMTRYDVLTNVIDDRNRTSKQWLRFLGFTFSEPFILGHERRPFRKFELRR
jgi:hypothetical protein